MRRVITGMAVVCLLAAPDTADALSNVICNLAGRTAGQSIVGVAATSAGPAAVVTGLSVAAAAALGCRLIISAATPALIGTLGTTGMTILTAPAGTWLAATAASSAAAPPIGGAIVMGAIIGVGGTLLAVHAIPYAWNALPEATRKGLNMWVSRAWDELAQITARYGRAFSRVLGVAVGELRTWVMVVLDTIAPQIYAQTRVQERGRYLHVFSPYEMNAQVVEQSRRQDPRYWDFPVPGM